MPFIDWIPGVSQLKTIVQLGTGDTEGAKRTVVNFARECPVVSQLTSIVQLAVGDTEGAIETQKHCIGTVNNVVNGVPVVGHVKGVVHHAFGDHKGGNEAWNAATRSTVVASSGVAAAIVSGGIGAIPAAIAAGAIYDVAASLISGEEQGIVAALKNAVDNPSAGAILDLVAVPVGDGLAGYSGGKIGDKMNPKISATMKIINKVKEWTGLLNREASRNIVIQVTSEISTFTCGTLKYATDGKARQVADRNNRRPKETSNYYFPVVICQEYLHAWDEEMTYFEEEDAVYLNSFVRQSNIPKQVDLSSNLAVPQDKLEAQGSLRDTYRGVNTTTLDILSELLRRFQEDPNRDPNRNPELKKVVNQLLRTSWLFLIMPEEFPYAVVTLLNSETQGVQHSFIRHIDQWREVIAFDSTLIDRISPLMTEITKLAGTVNVTETDEARDEFVNARSRLRSRSPETYYDVQTAFVNIQMLLHVFIQKNMTFDNYLERTFNYNGHKQLHFKVMTKEGKPKVMVVCLSDQLYDSDNEIIPPIKELITVFFKPLKQRTNRRKIKK